MKQTVHIKEDLFAGFKMLDKKQECPYDTKPACVTYGEFNGYYNIN